jgi:hypothetical protein
VRHDGDLTRSGGLRPPRLPAHFTTCNGNVLATSYVLQRSCRKHRVASSRNGSFVSSSRFYISRWIIWALLKRGGAKRDCKASLVGQHASPRLCIANAPNRSLSSPPNCKRICKPSQEAIGPQALRAKFIRPLNLIFSENLTTGYLDTHLTG